MSEKLKIDDQLIQSWAIQKLPSSTLIIWLRLKLKGLDNCENLPENYEIQYMFQGVYSEPTVRRSINILKEKGLIK